MFFLFAQTNEKLFLSFTFFVWSLSTAQLITNSRFASLLGNNSTKVTVNPMVNTLNIEVGKTYENGIGEKFTITDKKEVKFAGTVKTVFFDRKNGVSFSPLGEWSNEASKYDLVKEV